MYPMEEIQMRKIALVLLSFWLLVVSAWVVSAEYVSVISLDDGCKGELRDSIGNYEAKPGNTFLIVGLEIESHGANSFYVDPGIFEIEVDNIGYTVCFSVATYSLNDYLDTVRLRDGGKISGRVAYEVPKGEGDKYCLEYVGWDDCEVRFSCPCN